MLDVQKLDGASPFKFLVKYVHSVSIEMKIALDLEPGMGNGILHELNKKNFILIRNVKGIEKQHSTVY